MRDSLKVLSGESIGRRQENYLWDMLVGYECAAKIPPCCDATFPIY